MRTHTRISPLLDDRVEIDANPTIEYTPSHCRHASVVDNKNKIENRWHGSAPPFFNDPIVCFCVLWFMHMFSAHFYLNIFVIFLRVFPNLKFARKIF